jgi:hypothetical protein
LAEEYEGRVTVVGPAWKSSLEDTAEVAEALMPSGRVLWGLDETQEIFSAYGIGGQPAGAIIAADGSLVVTWPGARSTDEIREALDEVLSGSNSFSIGSASLSGPG